MGKIKAKICLKLKRGKFSNDSEITLNAETDESSIATECMMVTQVYISYESDIVIMPGR